MSNSSGPFDAGPPDHVLRAVQWHNEMSPKGFSLWRVKLVHAGRPWPALIYRPHPETKPEHHQPEAVVEVLAPLIPDLSYGDRLTLTFD